MQDKIKNIESVYQSQLSNLNSWREQSLNAVHRENNLPPPLPSFPSEAIRILHWKESQESLKQLYEFFRKEKFILKEKEEEYMDFFYPHFNKGSLISSGIKCINIINVLWVIYVLQEIKVITINDSLHIVLPQHFSDKKGNILNYKTLKTYLTRIRRARDNKNIPAFIQDLLFIFPNKSLPEVYSSSKLFNQKQ